MARLSWAEQNFGRREKRDFPLLIILNQIFSSLKRSVSYRYSSSMWRVCLLASWTAALSSVVCRFVLFAGQLAFSSLAVLLWDLAAPVLPVVEAAEHGDQGEGAFPQRPELILFLQVKSKGQYTILAGVGSGFLLPINSRLKDDFIYYLQSKASCTDHD